MKKKFRSSFSTCFAIVFFDLLLGAGILIPFSLWAVIDRGVSINPGFWILGLGLAVFGGWLGTRFRHSEDSEYSGDVGIYRDREDRNQMRASTDCHGPISIGSRNDNRAGGKLTRAFSNFKLGLSLLSKNRSLLPAALVVSLVIFLLTNLRMYLIFSAFGAEISFMPIIFASALFGLSNLLPGTPIKIGQYELFGLMIFTFFLGLDKNLVAAAILFSHLLAISFSLLGGFTASTLLGIGPISPRP